MFIPFDQMAPYSRVWIYQSVTPLNTPQQSQLLAQLTQFIQTWDSHGRPLKASAQLLHNHFIVLALDESLNPASGCSIDKSVHFLQELEARFGLSLFDRSQQAYWQGDQVAFVPVKEIKTAVEKGTLHPDTVVFNNLVPTLSQLNDAWQVPAAQSWLARYFRKQPAA